MDVDVTTLAAGAVAALVPALPMLVDVGKGAAGEIGKRTVGKVSDAALGIWHLLRPKVDASPVLAEAVTDLAQSPDDEDAQAALRVQIRKALTADPELAAQLQRVMENSQTSVTQTVVGSGNVVAGRDMKGNTITTNTGTRPTS